MNVEGAHLTMSRYLILLPAPEAEWADLRAARERLAARGEHIELRRPAE